MNPSDNDNATRAQHRRLPSRVRLLCPACGGAPRRATARFCATCGRKLDCADYLPTDQLRASYHLHRPSHVSQTSLFANKKYAASPLASVGDFRRGRNSASTMAMTFVAYALVPYFGTLFCFCAVAMGVVGLLAAARTPRRDEWLASLLSIVLGLLIFCAQLFLWSIALRIFDLRF